VNTARFWRETMLRQLLAEVISTNIAKPVAAFWDASGLEPGVLNQLLLGRVI